MVDRQEVFDEVVRMLFETAKTLYADGDPRTKHHMVNCIKELDKLLKLDEMMDTTGGLTSAKTDMVDEMVEQKKASE